MSDFINYRVVVGGDNHDYDGPDAYRNAMRWFQRQVARGETVSVWPRSADAKQPTAHFGSAHDFRNYRVVVHSITFDYSGPNAKGDAIRRFQTEVARGNNCGVYSLDGGVTSLPIAYFPGTFR